MPGLIRITAPATEPLSLAEAKAHLRVSHTADDTLITTLISVAREACEDYTARALITQGWRLWLNGFPELAQPPEAAGSVGWWDGIRDLPVTAYTSRAITLPRAPLLAVSAFTTFDANDVESTIPAANYFIDNVRTPGQLVLDEGVSIPANTRTVNALKIDFTAGYGPNATDVPATLRHGILHHMASLYENRGDTSTGIPPAALQMYAPYRITRLA
jgi:hypothetical protein